MGTISKDIAINMINGKHPTDRTAKIVTYNNMFDGGLTFANVYEYEDLLKYEHSPACHNVQTVWTAWGGMTEYGIKVFGIVAAGVRPYPE